MPVRPEDADLFAPEKAFLVGVDWGRREPVTPEESLDELETLVTSAGAAVVGAIIQKRKNPEASLLIGSGKTREVAAALKEKDANLVVFDEALSPAQQRNLERELDVRVIDRPAVILDIFARRAQTNEGRLQVALAQLEYQLPRLRGWGGELSRLAGGIGTRGPGETKLEADRRRVVKAIAVLKRKLREVARRRDLQRRGREGMPLVALTGYTNSGKTTLLNRIAGAAGYAADQPFATLDPFVKRVRLPSGRQVLVADTVGFIAKLPADLVTAFRATFEELGAADVLVVVSDVTAANLEGRAAVVEELLTTLGARNKPRIDAFNKCDLRPSFSVERYKELGFSRPLAVSAATGEGLEELLAAVDDVLASSLVRLTVELPAGPLVSSVYERGRVLAREDLEGRILIRAEVPAELARLLRPYARGEAGREV